MLPQSVPPSFFDLSFQAVSVVDGSWLALKQIPGYEKMAGELLYRKMFEIAPGIANMFDFDEGTKKKSKQADDDSLVDIFRSPMFKKFIMGVLSMLDAALNMLGPDVDILTEMLTELGGRHVAYGVMPVHYGIFGRALLSTLHEMLGEARWNKELNDGWSAIFGFISASMMVGASDKIQASKRKRDQCAAQKTARKSGKEVVPTKEVEVQHPFDADILRAPVKSDEPPENIKILVDQALDLFETGSVISDATSLSDTSMESEDEFSFQESTATSSAYDTSMVSHVSKTWARIKKMPAYETIAGVLLFQKIFELKPEAIGPFESALGTSQELYENPGFVAHVRGVIRMLDAVVNMLGPDLEPVTYTLERLGRRHVAYGLSTDYFEVVGEALIGTLEVALGKHWTPEAKEGWIWIHTFLTTSLVKGMNDQIMQQGLSG